MPVEPYSIETAATGETPSVMPLERSRVLPRLSFQLLLSVVTVTAFGAFTLRLAWAGSAIATAIIYSISMIGLCFAAFGVLFLIAWVFAVIGQDGLEDIHHGNPFSEGQFPPQLLPPREPGT